MQHPDTEYPLFHAVLDQLFPEGLQGERTTMTKWPSVYSALNIQQFLCCFIFQQWSETLTRKNKF